MDAEDTVREEGQGKTYAGRRTLPGETEYPGVVVTVSEEGPADDPGESSWRLWTPRYHSPAGLDWGYHGSGPADLALALLMDALNEEYSVDERYNPNSKAMALHQEFKNAHVIHFSDTWRLTQDEILEWVRDMEDVARRKIRFNQ